MFKKMLIVLYFFVSILVIIWTIQIVQGEIPYIDKWTRTLVAQLQGTNTYDFFSSVTVFGGRTFLIPFTIILSIILWFIYKSVLPAIFFGIGTYGGHLFNLLIKHLVERERPSISVALNAEGYSFPSGHAMNAIVCYGILTYFLIGKISSRRWRNLLKVFSIIVILIVGLSRYVINVHFLTDVIAGYFFGSLYLFFIIFLYKKSNEWKKGFQLY